MRQDFAKRQRGAALLAMLAVIMLGSSWYLVSRLNAESGSRAAVNQVRNAEVLNRAKLALIGYVAAQAANSGEDNPGALPCPEAAGYFDNPSQEGQTASGCTLPKVGRFPWRTIGTEKLVDASGEPLWYVVSPGWARTSGNTNINSNSVGQLTVDGVANSAVALIIAPGPAFSVPTATGCAARNQVRPTTGTPDWRNYLECENATYPTPNLNFVTTGPSGSFNDQIIRVTVADIMPGIEAAIANRIERTIVPTLKTVYTSAQWAPGISNANPLFPFPAPFGNPGTSNFQGAAVTIAGAPQGLLPFNQTRGCNPATDTRCAPFPPIDFLVFSKSGNDTQTAGSGSIRTQSSCSWQSDVFVCTGEYLQPTISVTVRINVTKVAMGLRTPFDATKVSFTAMTDTTGGWGTQTISHTATAAPIDAAGSVTITVAGGPLPDIVTAGWGTYANYRVSIDRAAFGDHALLNPVDPPNQTPSGPCPATGCTGWFVRNEWYRLLYYAVAPTHTAAQLPGTLACTTGANCLTVTNLTPTPTDNKRALLILAGRSLGGAARPNGTLSDFVEFDNADLNTIFEKQPISKVNNAATKRPFNDRVIVLDSN